MNIGFDIDGVMTNFRDFMITYGKKFFNKEIVNQKGFNIQELFDCSAEEEFKFWNKYLLKYVTKELPRCNTSKIINELKEDERNKIFIITLRIFTDKNNIMGKLMRYIVKKWLEKNNIHYDEIIFSDSEDKSIDILTNDIDVMIEDSPANIKNISKYTNVICINEEYNEDVTGENIYRAYDMEEVKKIIDNIAIIYNKSAYDENKTLTGKPSIDKPWYKYYTYAQVNRKLPKQKIYDYLWNNNKNNLNAEALNYFGRSIKFDELFKEIDKCAHTLKTLGVKKNDIVTICSPNIPEAIYVFYAINRIGAISHPMHPLSTEKELITNIEETNSQILFFIDIAYEEIKTVLKKTNIKCAIALSSKDSLPLLSKVVVTKDLKNKCNLYKDGKEVSNKITTWDEIRKIKSLNEEKLDTEYKENMPAVILNTGGTTGVSKCAVISNDNFNAMVHQYKMKAKFNKGDKMVAMMPMFHGFGLCNSIHMPMCLRASSILIPKFDSKQFYKMMFREHPNHIMGVPTLWKGIQSNPKYENKDLSFLNGYCVSGGDTMKEDFEHTSNKFLEIHNSPSTITKGYGSTEAVASVTFTFEDCNAIGSIGIPLVNTNIKIVDPNTNEELGYNQEGELCISGPTVMLYYYNNDVETSKDLRVENNQIWLHTGDIGYVNEKGMFFYTDRLKRVIMVSGINVYPSKIEQIIEEHPDVLQCVCVGKYHSYKQNVPKVYIVLKEGKYLSDELKRDLLNLYQQKMPNKYYKISEIEQIDDLPKTAIGKTDYKKLNEIEQNKESNNSYVRSIINE